MTAPATTLVDRTERNRVAAARLPMVRASVIAVVAVVVVVVGSFLLPLFVTVPMGLVLLGTAAVVAVVLPRSAVEGLAAIVGGRPAGEDEFPRLHNLIEGLTTAAGVEAPRLLVIDDDHLNLFVAGAPGDAILVLTSGLLSSLDRVELEGALAYALARIRSYDAYLGAQAALFVCGPLLRNGPRRAGRPMAVASAFSPWRAGRLAALHGAHHDVLCDFATVDVTRYPPALASAFRKMIERGTSVDTATWGAAHLWLADPLAAATDDDGAATRLNGLFARQESLTMRADLMEEL